VQLCHFSHAKSGALIAAVLSWQLHPQSKPHGEFVPDTPDELHEQFARVHCAVMFVMLGKTSGGTKYESEPS